MRFVHGAGQPSFELSVLREDHRHAFVIDCATEFVRYRGHERKDLDQAIAAFKEAISIKPESEIAHFRLAIIYEEQDRFDEAVEQLRKTIELAPDNADALNYLGYMFAEKGVNLEEAEELIHRALELQPDNGYFTDSLGWVYYQQGEYEKAMLFLEKAVENIEEDDPIVREHLGDVYLKLDEPEKAKEQWERAYALDPDNESLLNKINSVTSSTPASVSSPAPSAE